MNVIQTFLENINSILAISLFFFFWGGGGGGISLVGGALSIM